MIIYHYDMYQVPNIRMDESEQTKIVAPAKYSLKESMWHDIDYDAEAIVVSDVKYNPSSLGNHIYKILDNRAQRHKFLKQNKIRGLYKDFDDIRQHRDTISEDPIVSLLLRQLFKEEEISSITPLDCVFVNAYYRRLLRAQIECEYLDKELTTGLVVTEYSNAEIDATIVKTLRLLRVVCKFLGVLSTTHSTSIPADRLYAPYFWRSVSEHFIPLFGESRITAIPEPEDNDLIDKETHEVETLLMLNAIFNTWSGSMLLLNERMVEIVPATFVSRLLPKLK